MARGFLSGVIAGTLVSGLGLGTASVLTFEQGAPAPQPGGVEVPAGAGFSQSLEDTTAAMPASEGSPDATAASDVPVPEPDDLSALQDGDTEPAAQPEAGQGEAALAQPAEGAGDSGVEVGSDDPVLPSPQAAAPEAPAGEEGLSISTDPAQPALSQVVEEETAFPQPSDDVAAEAAPAMEGTGSTEPASAVSEPAEEEAAEVEPAEEETAKVESAAQPEVEAAVPEPAETAQVEMAEAEPAETAESDLAEGGATGVSEPAQAADNEVVTAQPSIDPVDPIEADPEPAGEAAEAEAMAEPEPVVQPTPEEVAILQANEGSSSTIGDLAPEVKTNRLPSVGDEAEAEAPEPEEQPEEPVAADAAEEDNRPPLERFATPFENPGNKPMMSIILIDDGTSPIGLQALQDFPYPLSFAVSAGWAGARDAMERYRAAGFEVLALTDLPESAGAQDVEQAMQAIFSALPEVVAVMDGTGSGLQSSREAAEQLAPILLSSGHGAVLFPKGLNTAQKLLAREGVPSAAVFRDFDAKGQNATVIRRFLDQAAFKAGQEDAGVVMVGRLRPDTVSALLLWGLQDRADRVALAPISALLGAGRE